MAIIPSDEKVFMVSTGTNTTYGGSAALKAMQQWYTMQDVSDSIQPYQVFTALLTQSGGDDLKIMKGDGSGDISSASKGTTVEIDNNANNIDYSSIGAPNSNVGTYFILTQDITLSNLDNGTTFKINLGAPVATVLENTIGNIWFNYEDTGVYGCQSNDLFITGKTFILATPTSDSNTVSITITNGFTSVIYISPLNNVLAQFNNGLINAPIEIRVYN